MPFLEEKIWGLINAGWDRMNNEQRRFWEAIRLHPQEWELVGYGRCWVVGLIGANVFYYNHFETGFNRSAWSKYGFIDQYQSLQWELDEVVGQQIEIIRRGYDWSPRSGPPIAGCY